MCDDQGIDKYTDGTKCESSNRSRHISDLMGQRLHLSNGEQCGRR